MGINRRVQICRSCVKENRVGIRAAVDRVRSDKAIDEVISGAGADGVNTGSAGNRVCGGAARDGEAFGLKVQVDRDAACRARCGNRLYVYDIAICSRVQVSRSPGQDNGVGLRAAINRVRSNEAVDGVDASASADDIRSVTARDGISPITGGDGVSGCAAGNDERLGLIAQIDDNARTG